MDNLIHKLKRLLDMVFRIFIVLAGYCVIEMVLPRFASVVDGLWTTYSIPIIIGGFTEN